MTEQIDPLAMFESFETKIHELKTLPEFFAEIAARRKTFEIRKDDRGFKIGDMLVLREWSQERGYHDINGLGESFDVTYVYRGPMTLPGHVVMSIRSHEICRQCLVKTGVNCPRCVRCTFDCDCITDEVRDHRKNNPPGHAVGMLEIEDEMYDGDDP